MSQPTRATTPSKASGLHWQITDDGSQTLWDERVNETYHSGCGAVVESLIVYLQNSGVHDRLRSGVRTAVLEYGFGTATAFLLTAAVAELHRVPLRYRALELSLLSAEVLAELRLDRCDLAPYYAEQFREVLHGAQELLKSLVAWRAELSPTVSEGIYRARFTEHVDLEVIVGDAGQYSAESCELFDAVYFDFFSPATCPNLWTRNVYQTAIESLRPGGSFTSYCVKSDVRHDLAALGLVVERVAGPLGGKREVLIATKPQEQTGGMSTGAHVELI